MTPLKPIENLRVKGVASTIYPLNEKCAHPECNERVVDAHHIFPRSLIKGDSWFVEIKVEEGEEPVKIPSDPLPHVTGLCREHHGQVESHDAWIKLEDGEFVWYDRVGELADTGPERGIFQPVGPLNPQPGSREGKAKRKRFKGEARRKRTTVSIKVPQDEQEDGAGRLDEQLELAGEKLVEIGLYQEAPSVYYRLMAALIFFNTHVEEVEAGETS